MGFDEARIVGIKDHICKSQRKLSFGMIQKVLLQGDGNSWKRQLFPGNLIGTAKCHFQTFTAGGKDRLQQAGAKEQVYLVNVADIEHGIQIVHFNICTGFFAGFTCGCLLRGCCTIILPSTRAMASRPENFSCWIM